MPRIFPSAQGMPADWRSPYNEFVRLKALAKRLGLNINGWSLDAPSRTKRMFDPSWTMTYIDLASERMVTVYLGSNGAESAKTIHTTAKPYERAVADYQPPPKPAPPPDPMFNPEKVKKAFELWQWYVKEKKLEQFAVDYPKTNHFLHRKAGIHNGTLLKYLTSSPMSRAFPTPPRSEAELKERKRIIEEQEKAMEQGRRTKEDNQEIHYHWEQY